MIKASVRGTPWSPVSAIRWLRDTLVYSPLAFAETAESIELAQSALAVEPGQTVAGITSSGDVLLSLLARGPARVIGFDTNETQTALARLKLLLAGTRDVVAYRSFLGLVPGDPAERRRTWDGLAERLGGDSARLARFDVERGLLNSGMSRWITQVVALGIRSCLDERGFARLLDPGATREERLALNDAVRASWNYRAVYRPMLRAGRRVFQHFFYPPALCANSDYPRRALDDIAALQRPFFAAGLADNPAVSRHLTGRVPSEHERLLYAPDAYAAIARHAGAAEFRTAAVESGLRALPAASVDAVYLSNCPDYLRAPALASLAGAIEHAAKPGARVHYVSLEPRCPFAAHGVPAAWRLDEGRAQALAARDPIGLYPFIGVGAR